MAAGSMKAVASPGHPRPSDMDRLVGLRLRQQRLMLGLTQQQMAELIGVTYQQAHKYETGINRISAGRLYRIAEALGVEVTYFFPNQEEKRSPQLTQHQRLTLELARNFMAIATPRHKQLVCDLARALAGRAPAEDSDPLAA